MGSRAKNNFPYLLVAKEIITEAAAVHPTYFESEAPTHVRIGVQYAQAVIATQGVAVQELRSVPPLAPLFHWKELSCTTGTKLSRLTSRFLLYLYLEPLSIPTRRKWALQYVNWDGIDAFKTNTGELGAQRHDLIQRYLHEYFDSRNVFRNLKRTRCAAGRSPTPPPRRPVLSQPARTSAPSSLTDSAIAALGTIPQPCTTGPLATHTACPSSNTANFVNCSIPSPPTTNSVSPLASLLPVLPTTQYCAAPTVAPVTPSISPPRSPTLAMPTVTTPCTPIIPCLPAASPLKYCQSLCPTPPACSNSAWPLTSFCAFVPDFVSKAPALCSAGLSTALNELPGPKCEVDFLAEPVTDYCSDISFLVHPEN